MSAAEEIRSKYADVIERAELRARADAGTACHLCAGEHRTSECPRGQLYIAQCDVTRTVEL